MYINPIVVGVIVTILSEVGLVIAYSLLIGIIGAIKIKKGKGDDK